MLRANLILLAITATVLAGCASNDEPAAADPSTTTSSATGTTTGTTSSTGTTTTTTTGPGSTWVERSVSVAANQTEGNAPLSVSFDANMTGADENMTYRLAHGDGTDQNGTGAPETLAYVYEVGGTFDAVLEVMWYNETMRANVTITVHVDDVQAGPDVTHFEYGESLGCWWDLATLGGGPPIPCISQERGPSGESVDGFWQALDERYWGLEFTSTVDHGDGACSSGDDWPLCDSDCFFYGESTAFGDEIGDGNNGGGACAGMVPDGAAWLFIFPYGGPSLGMVLDFIV